MYKKLAQLRNESRVDCFENQSGGRRIRWKTVLRSWPSKSLSRQSGKQEESGERGEEGKKLPTLLLLRNVVRVARTFTAFVFRSLGITARLTGAIVILQLRLVGHEKRLS